jgi:hypothetical protein
MKSLWLATDAPGTWYADSQYQLGYWDDETGAWHLNHVLAHDLLILLKQFHWGDPENCDVPNLRIEVRDTDQPKA